MILLFEFSLQAVELKLDRDWLPAAAGDEPIQVDVVGATPNLIELIHSDRLRVLWNGAQIRTKPREDGVAFEFTVPAELRTPGLVTLGLFDAAGGRILTPTARVAVVILGRAEFVEADPDSDRVVTYQAAEGSVTGGTINVFQLSTGVLVESISLPSDQRVLAFTPDTNQAWVAENIPQGLLARLDLSTRQVNARIRVTHESPPYDRLAAQVDRLDPRLLLVLVSAENSLLAEIRAYNETSALPNRLPGVSPGGLPLATDDRGRYIALASSTCALDPELGFADCTEFPTSGILRAAWKDKGSDGCGIFDLETGELLLNFGSCGSEVSYLPESNRVVSNFHGSLSFLDGDSLETLIRLVPSGAVIRKIFRLWEPDWLLAMVASSSVRYPFPEGVLATRMPSLVPAPAFEPSSLVHAGSSSETALSPGQIISIFGSNLGPGAGIGPSFEGQLEIATESGGVEVLFGGLRGAVLFANADQINVVSPKFAPGSGTVSVQVLHNGIPSTRVEKPVSVASPGLFAYLAAGRRYAAALNEDGSVNGPGTPTRRARPLALFATGVGLPARASASRVAARAAEATVRPTITIGGRSARILYAGTSPGTSVGVTQINLVVPPDSVVGEAVEVVIEAAGAAQGGTWIAVQ